MTQQLLDFDAAEGERLKREGMDRAARNRPQLLALARRLAVDIARERGEVTMDDVQAELVARGHSPHELGNAAGSVFRGDAWTWTGRFKQSERPHAHMNLIRVWRLT